jgi:WD40 repeat protein
MTRHTLVLIGLLALPISAQASLFGDSKSDVATKTTTLDEDGEILGLDFSPDGKHLAATPFDSTTVHVWNWKENRLERTLARSQGSNVLLVTEPVRYSADGKLLAICHTKGSDFIVARIWDTENWGIAHDIDGSGGGGACNAIGFTSDGKSLIRVIDRTSGITNGNFIVYDISSWRAIWEISTQPFHPSSLSISPDNKFVAIGGDIVLGGANTQVSIQPQIAIVDMEQRLTIRNIKNETGRHGSVAWSPNGFHLAYGGGDGIEIFDTRSGDRVVSEKTETKGAHVHIRYTPDGKYFIESGFGEFGTRVRIWDGKHQQLLQEIKALPGCIAVSRDGHYMAMGGDKKIIVWQLK